MERFTTALLLVGVVACGKPCDDGLARMAKATLALTAGNTAVGTVTFTEHRDEATINAKMSGLSPQPTRYSAARIACTVSKS